MSYLRDCQITVRPGDRPLFEKRGSNIVASLDGYAILPKEKLAAYEARIEDLERQLSALVNTPMKVTVVGEGEWDAANRRIEELESDLHRARTAPEDNRTMAECALEAIHNLLDSCGVPGGTFVDDHVRNLVALYNVRGDRIAELERALEEAIDGWEEGACYKGPFLRKHHGDDESIARLRQTLRAKDR